MRPRPKHSWEYERTQPCGACGKSWPLATYHAKSTDANGYAVGYRSMCQECRRPAELQYRDARRRGGGWERSGRWLPVGPLRAWLVDKTRSYTVKELEGLCGVSERVIYRQLHETKMRVSLDVADRMLTNAGVALWELYPDD